MADHGTPATERDPEAVRDEILRTRAHIDETVAALGERLAPGRLIEEAWHRFRSSDGPGVGEVVKEHPVPVALMGLGLGWLAIEQVTGRTASRERDGRTGPGTWAPAEGRKGPYLGDAIDHDDPDWAHAGPATKAKAKAAEMRERLHEGASERAGDLEDEASDAADKVKHAAHSAKEAVRSVKEGAHSAKEKMSAAADASRERVRSTADSARDAVEGARERGSRLRERARERAADARRRAEDGFWNMMDENPLAVGAIAFGLGLLGGAAVPGTAAEDRLVGRPSDTLKGEARRMARSSRRKAERVAKSAARAAADELDRQRDDGGSVREAVEATKESVSGIAHAAREAAARSAEEEGLTPEELGAEARAAGERAAREAKEDMARRERGQS